MGIKEHMGLLWRWSWAIVLCALLSGAGVWYMTRWIPPTYEASARLFVYQAPASSGTSDYTEILTSNRMVRSYAQALKARPLLDEVIDTLDLDMSAAALAQVLTVDIIRETQIMVLTVESQEPQQAADIANQLATLFIAQHYELTASLYADSRQNLEKRLDDIETKIDDAQDRLKQLGTVRTFQEQAEYDRVQMLLWQYRSEYSLTFHSLENVMMAEAQSTDLMHVIEPAIPAQTPSQPRTGFLTLLAAMGGAFLATATLTVANYLDDRVRTASQLENLTEQPVLAALPRRRRFFRQARNSLSDEVYYTLAAHLTVLSQSPPLTLLLTGAAPRQGTSTVALNLARGLARSGQRVILVDAALRQPVLHQVLGLDNQTGLSTLLAGTSDTLEQALLPTTTDNLWLLPAGPEAPSVALLSDLPLLCDILEDLKTRADIVLIDSLDVLSVVDTQLIALHTDAALLVVRSGAATTQALRQACRQLQQIEKPLIGSVLTGVRQHHTVASRFRLSRRAAHRPPGKAARQPVHPDASQGEPASSQPVRATRAPASQRGSSQEAKPRTML